jgi:hypothetical protein
MTTYVFDPGEMRGFAGDCRRAAGALNDASVSMLMVQTAGLPPEAAGRVEAQCRSLWLMLAAGADGLKGGASLLGQMASAVERADSKSMNVAGLDLVRTTKGGEKIFRELSDAAYRKPASLGDRARRWANALGALTGKKAIDQAVSWTEWQKALREAKVDPSTSAGRRLSAALAKRANDALDEARELNRRVLTPPPVDATDGKLKQWLRRLSGYVPGPAGDAADLFGYLSASQKLREDEPQTGVSQAATDVRDFVDLVGASNHLAADVFFKSPVTAPAGVINEGIGVGADGVVLGMDGLNEARKQVDSTIDTIGDGFKSLAMGPLG